MAEDFKRYVQPLNQGEMLIPMKIGFPCIKEFYNESALLKKVSAYPTCGFILLILKKILLNDLITKNNMNCSQFAIRKALYEI